MTTMNTESKLPYDVLLIHNDVTIYRVTRDRYDDFKPGFLQFTFSTEQGSDGCDDNNFDVRDLPTWAGTGDCLVSAFGVFSTEFEAIERAVQEAIEKGYIGSGAAPVKRLAVVDMMSAGAQRLRVISLGRR